MISSWFLKIKMVITESMETHEQGQTLVEYGLLLFLVAIVVIGAVLLVGEQTNALFQRVIDAWPGQ